MRYICRFIGSVAIVQRVPDSTAADECQQRECCPVVVRRDLVHEGAPQKPTQERHQKLEEAEGRCGSEDLRIRHSMHGYAAAKSHCKAVGRKTESHEDQREEVHCGKSIADWDDAISSAFVVAYQSNDIFVLHADDPDGDKYIIALKSDDKG